METTVRIEVSALHRDDDVRSATLLRQASDLGIQGVADIRVSDLYFIRGDFAPTDIGNITNRLLFDPVTQHAEWCQSDDAWCMASEEWLCHAKDRHIVETTFLPGVTDSTAENIIDAARHIVTGRIVGAACGVHYELVAPADAVRQMANLLLANPVVQTYVVDDFAAPPFADPKTAYPVAEIRILDLDDDGLFALSAERRLALDLPEMRAIQNHFRQKCRNPTDVELEMLAQTWSEHCSHKSFKARIEYQEDDRRPETIDSLFDTTIKEATRRAAKPWVRSAFVDNAGVVEFSGNLDIAFKVETHNHPSALEPFGGANTGVGGVIRDILGVSARPIAVTDVLCFGPSDLPFADLPSSVLHPKRIADGVISGIQDYGNKMGIPTVSGAIIYDHSYISNPLVYCGCLGILPRGSHPTTPGKGDAIVVVGGRTGRDGLRGATFSSMGMDRETQSLSGSAVQIGHPINEKKVLDMLLVVRDKKLYSAITDCGAGGLSSAIGEMALSAGLGAEIELGSVPLKYAGLSPWEIWLSEAQERMVFAVPQGHLARFREVCDIFEVRADVVGKFSMHPFIIVVDDDGVVCNLETEFLKNGMPQRSLEAVWRKPARLPNVLLQSCPDDLTDTLLSLLAHPDTRSKEDVIRRYDHEVQGSTVVKPLVGAFGDGPSDAAVLAPLEILRSASPGGIPGIAVGAGICPHYGAVDPYLMGWMAVDEAIRNVVSVGADPDRIALLDNFCWGDPCLPDRLGGLVRCARGCRDAAIEYSVPFISGKDSLNNEYSCQDGTRRAIMGTLLVSAIGIVPDISKTVTMDLKAPGSALYVVGYTGSEMGGSAYGRLIGLPGEGNALGPIAPPLGVKVLEKVRKLHRAISRGLVRACHDCSEGGLAVALAEMSLAGGLGAKIRLMNVPGYMGRNDVVSFSETPCRFVVEVPLDAVSEFGECMSGVMCRRIGEVVEGMEFVVTGIDGEPAVVRTDVAALRHAFCGK